jgi:signal transduction histidine kinase
MEAQPDKRGLDATAVHALSNHLAVILGFIELVLSDTPPEDPRRPDLEEIRQAAHECAQIVSRSHTQEA